MKKHPFKIIQSERAQNPAIFLDYAFVSNKIKIKNSINARKLIQNETKLKPYALTDDNNSSLTLNKIDNSSSYLYDLKNTLSLNIDLLKKFLSANKNQNNDIIQKLDIIIKKIEAKNELLNTLKNKKSKILIDNQIISIKKRKNEERIYLWNEKMKENGESLNLKNEIIKVLHKKLKEVEIYIHRNTKNVINKEKRDMYQTFSMYDFITNNNNLIDMKTKLNKNIISLKHSCENIFEENKKCKIKNEENEKLNIIKNNSNKNITIKYHKKVKLLTLRINVVKNLIDNINKKFKKLKLFKNNNLSINNKNDNNKTFDKEIIKEKEIEDCSIKKEKSKLTIDVSKRLDDLLDFSIILNNKNKEDTKLDDFTNTNNNFGNISNNNMWDISLINK